MTIDERIAAELRHHAPEVDEQMAWERIQSSAAMRGRGRALRPIPISVAALGFALLGIMLFSTFSSGPEPAGNLRSPFLGTWNNTDAEGSTQTMTIGSQDDAVEISVHDDFASVCSGAPSTLAGTGRLEGSTELVIPSPVLTCDDGSQPEASSGPPLQEQLRNLTFVHKLETDALTDNFGSVWERVSGDDPAPEPTTPTGMWPQSSLEEVREAQELADAGDTDFTWQLEPGLEEGLMTSPAYLDIPEIFARFLRDELGWEESSRLPGSGFGDGTIILTFVRCAPGQTNSVYPDDPRGGGCAPTIDEFRYETVEIAVAQPVRQNSSGIWVVTQWQNVEPIEQVIPPTEAEARAIVEAFLQARIAGENAEQYLGGAGGRAQLLYATSTGATYERFEFGLVSGPEWPDDGMRFEVRLFAEDGQTVVEQSFTLERDGAGDWVLELGSETLENGQALPFVDILDGGVTFEVAPPWDANAWPFDDGPNITTLLLRADASEMLRLVADPRPIATGCKEDPAPADAATLARSIQSDPDFQVTDPLATSVGGAPALRLDVTAAAGASVCDTAGIPLVMTETGLDAAQRQRMRVYLLDVPGESGRILAIAIIALPLRFERVLDAAAPILDSFEFHAS